MRRRRPPHRILAGIIVPLAVFAALAGWAFASPVGSSPDDDFHLASIWCSAGEQPGRCESTGDEHTRKVPTSVATADCYAYDATRSASCWDAGAEGLTETTRVDTGPVYPPLFYATMGVFVGPDIQVSVLSMRLFNAALFVGMLTATFWLLPRRLRPALILSTVTSAVPLGVFVYASTNPSSWALSSACVVWVAVYGATLTSGRRMWALSALALIAATIGAGARADAGVFAVFAAALGLLLGARTIRSAAVAIGTSALITAVGFGFYSSAGQSSFLTTGLRNENPPLTRRQLFENALEIPSLWSGAVGGSGLGWLDTVMPAIVGFVGTAIVGAVVIMGLHRLSVRRAVALTIAFIALWAVPFVLLAQSRAVVGTEVQPRYILPLLIIALGVASATSDAERVWTLPRRLAIGVGLTLSFSIALYTNVRRYTVGTDSEAINPGTDQEWWWTGVVSPPWLILIATATFASGIVLLALAGRPAPEDGRARSS
ncbi:DUF2142 domain-containing protein [Microbacterium sp. NE2HP2]|uniref:DUF2142 domain-containing protein n=1 Tax=Microbacterium plantarum TaxID=1816425 RepID=UPI00236622E7|nr:DUF2142 domain-containing protein [Microbacterium plantarum]MDD7945104.1 DUF2142 domain-containing protein [Microbacterium plantarum]